MTITFEQLLTDPKYREMDFRILNEVHIDSNLSVEEYNKGLRYFKKTTNLGKHLFNHLQKLKAESENMVFKDYEKVFDMFFKPINKPVTFTPTKPEPSIQITDQKAREICAKYFNCPPNEIKIV